MERKLGGRRSLWNLPARVIRKARQGPGPLAASVSYYLWRRGPVFRIRRALAMRRLPARTAEGAAARCPGVPGLVSVVLPVYNQADLLGDSIESVLAQSYTDFELIVINDGSTDGVEAVLGRYAGHPKVRVLTQANQKLPKALSNGFSFARGEFWTWTSADNLMHPDQLARLVAFLKDRPDAAMVYADYVAIDDRGEPLTDPSFRPEDRSPADSPEIHLPRDPRQINVVCDNFIGPCFLYRNIVGRLIGDYDPGQGIEDYDYWMRVNHAFRIEHLGTDETLYRYRVHDRSLSGRAAELRIAERVAALMRVERSRYRAQREPWTILADAATTRRLADVPRGSHRWLDLDCPGADGNRSAHDDVRTIYLVEASGLDSMAATDRRKGSVVAAWFDAVDDAYESRSGAACCRAVGFSGRRDVAARLDLLGIGNLVVDRPESFLELAIRFADNREFFEQMHPEPVRRRTLPAPLASRAATRHVAFQVDDFTQGGLENVVLDLARGLEARGLRVSLLVLGKSGPAVDQARAQGLEVATLPAGRREAGYRAWLRENRVDLVYAHYSTYGARAAAELAIPFVQVVHNTYVWLDEQAIDAYREADAFTTAYLCVSAEVARYCDRRLGLDVDKMVIVPNGVDVGRLDAARREQPGRLRSELGLADDDFVFLNVASIHATKAQKLLMRAMATVVAEFPRARLVLAGSASDPEYERQLRGRIAELGLERHVVLAGQRADVGRFYWMADAFVLPSYWEGWSLALTEAACTGLPLVASDVGGARETLAIGTGRLVRPPFATIGELDSGTISDLVRGEDSRYIDDLAAAMRETARAGSRVSLAETDRRFLDVERMTDVHFTILGWILQGGQAAGARAWSRAVPVASRAESDEARGARDAA
ncbi:MAG: glycosyltransferase [Isosphaeraceae bacterium]